MRVHLCRVGGTRITPLKTLRVYLVPLWAAPNECAYSTAHSPQNCKAILKTLLALPAVSFAKRPRMALHKKERSESTKKSVAGSTR